MNTRSFQDVIQWLKTTDLAEVSYRRAEDRFRFRVDDAPVVPESALSGCSLVPVISPEVGLFRASELGRPRKADKDADVSEGDELGVIEAGRKKHKVKAAASGRIAAIRIEDGQPVEYGQPLFFIRPR